MLRDSPLLEACFVDIISARGSTPDDLLSVRFKLHEADWTLSLNGLPLATVVIVNLGLFTTQRRSFIDFTKLLSKQY